MKKPIYFISDVHFYLKSNDSEKEKIAKVSDFFDKVIENQGTLFIVGDFFDFWFEYKAVIPRHFFQILYKLRDVKLAGCEIHYIAGNHDFWVGDFLKNEIGAEIYTKPLEIVLDDKKFLIIHGDGIDETDHGYKLLKSVLRNKFIIKMFSLITPALAFWIARSVSHTSRKFDSKDPKILEKEQKVMKTFVRKKFDEGFDCIVMGHYHQPEEMHEDGHVYLNCGDWIRYFTYGFYDGELKLMHWDKSS